MAGRRLSKEEKDKILDYTRANMHLSIAKISKATGFKAGTVDYVIQQVIGPEARSEARARAKEVKKTQDISKMNRAELIEIIETQKEIIKNLRCTAMALRGIKAYESY